MAQDLTSKKKVEQLTGVFAAALTPMDDGLNVDHEAFAANCRRLLDAGCHGLGIFGTTGEANSLSADERIAALEALVAGGIPGERLLPGTGSCALTEAVRLSRAALEAGALGVLVLLPFYYKGVGDDGLFRFFAGLIERVADPRLRVYLYHFPQMTGVGISPSLIERLLEAYPGVIVGTKDSAGDWGRIEALCREFPGFRVFAGTERFLLDTLRQDGAGCISATVNVTARQARLVHDAHVAGRDEEAAALQKQLTDLRETIEAYPTIPALKGIMGRLTGEDVWRNIRPPLTNLEEGRADELLSRLRKLGLHQE
ncbi:MAG: dihydrodipicolinate synthase family protein [Rubrobacter sp.]|nr:dihydrodipicolinate synthase family protein [Rubrobacter sp.]